MLVHRSGPLDRHPHRFGDVRKQTSDRHVPTRCRQTTRPGSILPLATIDLLTPTSLRIGGNPAAATCRQHGISRGFAAFECHS